MGEKSVLAVEDRKRLGVNLLARSQEGCTGPRRRSRRCLQDRFRNVRGVHEEEFPDLVAQLGGEGEEAGLRLGGHSVEVEGVGGIFAEEEDHGEWNT